MTILLFVFSPEQQSFGSVRKFLRLKKHCVIQHTFNFLGHWGFREYLSNAMLYLTFMIYDIVLFVIIQCILSFSISLRLSSFSGSLWVPSLPQLALRFWLEVGPGLPTQTQAPGQRFSSFRKMFSVFREKLMLFPSKIWQPFLHISPVKSITASHFSEISSPPGPYHDTGPRGSVPSDPLSTSLLVGLYDRTWHRICKNVSISRLILGQTKDNLILSLVFSSPGCPPNDSSCANDITLILLSFGNTTW